MNQNVTHREWLRHATSPRPSPPGAERETVPGRGLPDGAALVQTFEGAKERLVRDIMAVSGPMNQRNAVKYQHYLLTLRVDVLQGRLELLKRENDK